MISVPDVGRRAASVAVRLLGGEEPGKIRPEPIGYSSPIFDWRELQRWNISEKRLPPGSEIRFRPPSIWEQYRTEVMVAFAALLLQSLVISALLLERNRRRGAELRARRHLLESVHLNGTATAGAMSASIAHELSQPLGAILSNTEAAEVLLQANPPDLDQLKDILDDIRHADQRANEIIGGVRRLLKKRSEIELQELDLNSAVDGVLQILGPEARTRDILLRTNQVSGALPIRADQVHLQQAIMNLVINGMDAMASCVPGTRKLSIDTALAGGSHVEVSVADSGSGIPKDQLKDIFETFYTTKQHGTGLGLSIARTIIETHGGKIWAENRAGGGAVFRFTLPLTKAQGP